MALLTPHDILPPRKLLPRTAYLFSESHHELCDLSHVDHVLGVILASVDNLRAPRHLSMATEGSSAVGHGQLSHPIPFNNPPIKSVEHIWERVSHCFPAKQDAAPGHYSDPPMFYSYG